MSHLQGSFTSLLRRTTQSCSLHFQNFLRYQRHQFNQKQRHQRTMKESIPLWFWGMRAAHLDKHGSLQRMETFIPQLWLGPTLFLPLSHLLLILHLVVAKLHKPCWGWHNGPRNLPHDLLHLLSKQNLLLGCELQLEGEILKELTVVTLTEMPTVPQHLVLQQEMRTGTPKSKRQERDVFPVHFSYQVQGCSH